MADLTAEEQQAAEQQLVNSWNSTFGVGTPVCCWPGVIYAQAWNGRAAGKAFVMPGGPAAVEVRGSRFPVPLSKVEFRPEGRGEPYEHTTDLVDLDTWEMVRNLIDEADSPEEATRAALRMLALRGWLAHITPEAVEALRGNGTEED